MLKRIENEVNQLCKHFASGTIPIESIMHNYVLLHKCITDMYHCGLIVRETQRKYEGALQPLITIILQGR